MLPLQRRLLGGLFCVAILVLQTHGAVDYAAVRLDLLRLMRADLSKAPTVFRLSWHCSGTYDGTSDTGGSETGTIRFKEELAHTANPGLDRIEAYLHPIYQKYQDQKLSHGDFYTLAGVVAVEAMGGPLVKWRAGRVDTEDRSRVTPDGRLPSPDKGSIDSTIDGLRKSFHRMGFTDEEIVVLSGGHSVGRCHYGDSGYQGPWTTKPEKFTNLYFRLLLHEDWERRELDNGHVQYENDEYNVMMLPSDFALIQDPGFKQSVRKYARDKDLFFSDFALAYAKLLELGCFGLYEVDLIPRTVVT